jgi:hypothetical protein
MSNCEFIQEPSLLGRNGDIRRFKIGEPVCLKDGIFTEGTYEGSRKQPGTEKVVTHYITSINKNTGEVYRQRWVPPKNVGKKRFPVSKTAMKKVLENKVGDPYFAEIMSKQGYGGKRKTRKHHKKSRKTRRNRRV